MTAIRYMQLIPLTLCCVFLWVYSPNLSAAQKDRKALIIGNSQYSGMETLINPENDARSVAAELRALDFEVDLIINASFEDMQKGLEEFIPKLNKDTVSVVYYAGHGVQNDGVNYLIPSDADIEQTWQLKSQTLSLNTVLDALNSSSSPLKIVMLDACRDNPLRSKSGLPRSMRTRGGLAAAGSESGSIMSFATAPDRVAYDGDEVSEHSPYTEALLNHMKTPEITVVEMLNRVGNEVRSKTSGRQIPWQNVSPVEEFCFNRCRNLSSDALARELNEISEAFELENYRLLKDQLKLNSEQAERLFTIFQTYDQINVTEASIERARSDRYANATFLIDHAITSDGKTVIPAQSWGKIELQLQKDGDSWWVDETINAYLQPLPGQTVPDIIAPNAIISDKTATVDENRLLISSEVIDNDLVDSVRLFYRVRGSDTTYRSTLMSKNGLPNYFSGTIDAGTLRGNEIEVYVEATDRTGNTSRWPQKQQPMIVNVEGLTGGLASGNSKRPWIYIGLGVLAVAIAASASSGSGGNGEDNPEITVTITTPLP